MAPTVQWLAVVTMALLLAPSHAVYQVNRGDLYQVAEADRISPKQLYARDAYVMAKNLPNINLHFAVPGRVYVRHVANDTAIAAGVLARLRASGDTIGAVEYISLPYSGESKSDLTDEIWIGDMSDTTVRRNTNSNESVLLEVEFYQKNVVKRVEAVGSADVVVLEDVIYMAEDGMIWAEGTELNAYTLSYEDGQRASPARLFVSDPKAHWKGSNLFVTTEYLGGATVVQIDVASINSTQTEMWVKANPNSTVSIFASEFVSPIFKSEETKDDSTTPPNRLCVATKVDVTVLTSTLYDTANPVRKNVTSVVPGGSTCEKLPLPPCEPAPIRDFVARATYEPKSDPLDKPTAKPTTIPTAAAMRMVSPLGSGGVAAVFAVVLSTMLVI